jgi:hypothetical protein
MICDSKWRKIEKEEERQFDEKENLVKWVQYTSGGFLCDDFKYEYEFFFGQPLIDAYLLQDQLFYYGVIVDNNAELLLKRFIEKKPSDFIHNHFIRLLTPLKTG